jgi:hypothetical protein
LSPNKGIKVCIYFFISKGRLYFRSIRPSAILYFSVAKEIRGAPRIYRWFDARMQQKSVHQDTTLPDLTLDLKEKKKGEIETLILKQGEA